MANIHPSTRLAGAALCLLGAALCQAHAASASAYAYAEVRPYWGIDFFQFPLYYTEGASVIDWGRQGLAGATLLPNTLTPPASTYKPIAPGSAQAYANAPAGQLGLAAAIRYNDRGGDARAGASIGSGTLTYSGGRSVIVNGLYWNYLGNIRLTLHGSIDGIANGGLSFGGDNVTGAELGIRNDVAGVTQVSCQFGGGGPNCAERASANLSGNRAFSQATWQGNVGRSFNLAMDLPLLVNPYTNQFSIDFSLGGSAYTSHSLMAGGSIDMLSTSTLRFTPWEGVTVNFGNQFLSAVPEPATTALWALGALLLAARCRRRTQPGSLGSAGLALVLAAGSMPAAAAGTLSGRVVLGAPLLGLSHAHERTTNGPTLTESVSLAAGPVDGPHGGGSAFASASFGTLRAASSFQAEVPGMNSDPFAAYDGGASATVGWLDNVTITAPGQAGRQGTLQVRLVINGYTGALAAGGNERITSFAEASWSLGLELGRAAGNSQRRSGGCSTLLPGGGCMPFPDADPMGAWVTDPISFTFGWPMQLRLTLDSGVFTRTVGPGATSGQSNLAHTVVWGGLDAVRDASGTLLTDFGVTSDSGTRWAVATPVPEPATPALLLAGVAVLALWRRRASMSARPSGQARGGLAGARGALLS